MKHKNREWQVVSLDLAKQLKEAGYEQEGLWWWINIFKDKNIDLKYHLGAKNYGRNDLVAPTVAELGETLPKIIKGRNLSCYNHITHWIIGYIDKNKGFDIGESDKSEANARAKMWLYLKKENLL